ncbi:MAG: TatD family hydrolase [Proteobacteria bacterium]|nr:TatD family hydrolase [Pseudomonadota bacterium]
MDKIVDSHCHLDFDSIFLDLQNVISRAKEAGVCFMQTICTEIRNIEKILQVANASNIICCSIGTHPDHAHKEQHFDVEYITSLCRQNDKIIGIGETGLDYYRSTNYKAHQQESFYRHIEAAQITNLPLIIHTRCAEQDTASMLKRANVSGVLHCFTGSIELARKCLDMGFYISASGIITFKNAQEIREVFKYVPIDRILIETDSPFLAPIPHRGKTNEPSYVLYVARAIADLIGRDFAFVAEMTTNNFFNLFQKATLCQY